MIVDGADLEVDTIERVRGVYDDAEVVWEGSLF